ncbi:MAG: glycosyltransferase family 2 protein, partial [Rhodospirillales bacterium]
MAIPIALVTPCFNGGAFLAAAMDSIIGQTYPALEYGVMDGGSTDGSLTIVEARREHLAFYESGPDGGMYDALNKGFARTSAPIMGWLNADDLHCPWTLQTVSDIFETLPDVDWITTAHPLVWDGRGLPVRCRPRGPYGRKAFRGGHFLPRAGVVTGGWIQQESTFWRRSLWEKAGGTLNTSFKLAADFDLWARFFVQADLVAVDVPLAGFRRHGDQQSLNQAGLYEAEALQSLERHGGKVWAASKAGFWEAGRRILPRRL